MKELLNNQHIATRQVPVFTTKSEKKLCTKYNSNRFSIKGIYAISAIVLTLLVLLTTAIVIAPEAQSQASQVANTLLEPLGGGDPQIGSDSIGSGYGVSGRDRDIKHEIRHGESLSEIAYFYGIDPEKLAAFNDISNPNRVKSGQILNIPSRSREQSIRPVAARQAPIVARAVPQLSAKLKIVHETKFDGQSYTTHFSALADQELNIASYEWDLGNGRKSFRPETFWSYEKPGTYTISLRGRGEDGRFYSSEPCYLDVPHPLTSTNQNQQFITLGAQMEEFSLDGKIIKVNGYDQLASAPFVLLESNEEIYRYRATEAGYFSLVSELPTGKAKNVFLFVSPIPSKHSQDSNLNWYRTQFNTGTLSNCGPSTVSMAAAWSQGTYLPVFQVRQNVGWRGDGGTSFEQLTSELKKAGVPIKLTNVRGDQALRDVIDRGNIAIVLINTARISKSRANPANDLFGRYYNDNVGHYVVVKGYSLDGKYFVVYDPVPSDWSANNHRYSDGISMMGQNRYYLTSDVMSGLRRNEVIEINK